MEISWTAYTWTLTSWIKSITLLCCHIFVLYNYCIVLSCCVYVYSYVAYYCWFLYVNKSSLKNKTKRKHFEWICHLVLDLYRDLLNISVESERSYNSYHTKWPYDIALDLIFLKVFIILLFPEVFISSWTLTADIIMLSLSYSSYSVHCISLSIVLFSVYHILQHLQCSYRIVSIS